MSIVLKARKKHQWGWEQNFPLLGLTSPSKEDGTFTVENDELAHDFIKRVGEQIGFEYADSKLNPVVEDTRINTLEAIKSKSEEDQLSTTKGNEQFIGVDDGDEAPATNINVESDPIITEAEKIAFAKDLQGKNYKEVEELCKAFPGGEWRSLKREERIQYLIKKLG